jgi:hypothetical protein
MLPIRNPQSIKRDEMKTQDMKRKRLLRKYHTEKKENLDQETEELKQKVSAKMQHFSGCRKRQ